MCKCKIANVIIDEGSKHILKDVKIITENITNVLNKYFIVDTIYTNKEKYNVKKNLKLLFKSYGYLNVNIFFNK